MLLTSYYLSLSVFYSPPPCLSGTFSASIVLIFLTVGLWNAKGFRNKSSEFKDFIYASNLDVILVCETNFQWSLTVKVGN